MHHLTSSACHSQHNYRPLCSPRASYSRKQVLTSAVSAPSFDVKGSAVVTMKTRWQKTSLLMAKPEAVEQYTQSAPEYLKHLYLPLGARFVPMDLDAQPAKFTLQLPELRFVTIAVRPRADVKVATGPGKVDVTTYGSSVEVSDKLQGLKLHERYSVDAAVSVRATSDKKLHTSAALALHVDIPPMFKMTPKAMIQVTGTAVLSNVVNVLMEDFVKTMLRDIEEISSDPPTPIDLLEGR